MPAVPERRSTARNDPSDPEVSVVIACHSEDRLTLLQRAVASALAQDLVPVEVVIAVDNSDGLAEALDDLFRDQATVRVVRNSGVRGASATRNCGVRAARSELVAFLDDDVIAHPMWLGRLVAPLADPTVAGTGGGAEPRWGVSRPRWFPDEFLWVVGASFKGMPTTTAEVRNVWSENMAIRRSQFLSCGGFREGFGKRRDVSEPEDTELCIRFARRSGDRWVYVPDAQIEHFVPRDRSTFRFFLNRCNSEGRGKVAMRRLTGSVLTSERSYAMRTLPAGAVRYLLGALRGDVSALLRGFALFAGGVAAAVGATTALLHGARSGGPSDAG